MPQATSGLAVGGVPVLLATIDATPDTSAFVGGVEVGLSIALIVVALLGALSLVRRIMGA